MIEQKQKDRVNPESELDRFRRRWALIMLPLIAIAGVTMVAMAWLEVFRKVFQ